MIILHIEDDPLMQDVVATTIHRFLDNATLTQVADLAAAKTALKNRAPNLMLLDITLPDGNGLEWIQALSPAPLCPIVILSGQNIDGFMAAYHGPLNLSLIAKPFRPRELADHLQAITRSPIDKARAT